MINTRAQFIKDTYAYLFLLVKNLEVDANDFTFSTSENMERRQPYGSAKGCQPFPHVPNARFLINLTGTPFRMDESVSPQSLSQWYTMSSLDTVYMWVKGITCRAGSISRCRTRCESEESTLYGE